MLLTAYSALSDTTTETAPARAWVIITAVNRTFMGDAIVLAGGFTDEYGSYGPGDISIQETGAVHKPVADADGECIVLAVNEGPIVLTSPVGRLLNMLIK